MKYYNNSTINSLEIYQIYLDFRVLMSLMVRSHFAIVTGSVQINLSKVYHRGGALSRAIGAFRHPPKKLKSAVSVKHLQNKKVSGLIHLNYSVSCLPPRSYYQGTQF